ncbi:NAD(P)-dependent oxidoreductase [Mycolicibacterium sp. CH28]|uniref:mycofactocin-coupled SDR family oxidoreductase n=1 Tax=Mycolicibacterium sp. CH28 TaxID=2512237 RepID=UPI00108151E9|nr:mycofactocin-coupled SDR family oxidoreductase [Mycolicibacterium sp. CH28]TGD84347.1 NAD(P)-dependent oxidoreductase [Mycolicibacterium sp. CH28]
MGKLDDKVAFITGAARGQGRSHAVRFAEEGADIIAVDICAPVPSVPYDLATPEDMDATVKAVEATGRRIVAREADVRSVPELTAAVNDGLEAFGRLDIVVANAGINTPAPTFEMDESVWTEMIDINLTGVWKTLKVSVPHLVAGGRGGSVILVSSLAALKPYANTAHYSAAKGGLVSLMRVLAKELAPQGVRVNTVHPNTVGTGMVYNTATYKLFRPELDDPTLEDFEVAARTLNALDVATLDSSDITNAVMFLASDDGRFVTGTTQVIDAGGLLL